MKKILVILVAMMFLFAPMAFAISFTVNDDYYLGFVTAGLPANEFQESLFVYNLIQTQLGGALKVTQNSQSYSPYADNINASLPEATDVGSVKVDGNPTSVNLLGGFTYMLGKYGSSGGQTGIQSSHVWYVGGLTGIHNIADFDYVFNDVTHTADNLSHYTLFNPAPTEVPEPSTLLLFGAGIAGLAMYRRKRS